MYLPAYNVGSCSSVTAVSSLPVGSSSCVEVSSDIFAIPYVVATSLGTFSYNSGLCVNAPAVIALPKICRTHTK